MPRVVWSHSISRYFVRLELEFTSGQPHRATGVRACLACCSAAGFLAAKKKKKPRLGPALCMSLRTGRLQFNEVGLPGGSPGGGGGGVDGDGDGRRAHVFSSGGPKWPGSRLSHANFKMSWASTFGPCRLSAFPKKCSAGAARCSSKQASSERVAVGDTKDKLPQPIAHCPVAEKRPPGYLPTYVPVVARARQWVSDSGSAGDFRTEQGGRGWRRFKNRKKEKSCSGDQQGIPTYRGPGGSRRR